MNYNSSEYLRLAGVVAESVVDGPGLRYVIFVQGCPHGCEGCHNPETHSFDGGSLMAVDEVITKVLTELESDPLIEGVTISGGEPLCQAQALLPLAAEIKNHGYHLMIYTGYVYEDLPARAGVNELIGLADILVDGPFIKEEKDLTLHMRGSRNQRIIDLVKTRYRGGGPVIYSESGWDVFGGGFEEF